MTSLLYQILFEGLAEGIINDLRNVNSLGEIQEIVTKRYNLKQIGDGTTRNVYDLWEDRVLKLAKHPDNSVSNLQEVESYKCLGKEFAAEVYEYDSINYYWLVMEKVELITSNREYQLKLKELLGIGLGYKEIADKFPEFGFPVHGNGSDFHRMSNIFQAERYPKWHPNRTLKDLLCKNSPWFKELNNRLVKCRVFAGDLGMGNSGFRIGTGELVLLDYGFEMIEGDQSAC